MNVTTRKRTGSMHRETGSVLIMVVLSIPLFALLMGFVFQLGLSLRDQNGLQHVAERAALTAAQAYLRGEPDSEEQRVTATARYVAAQAGFTHNSSVDHPDDCGKGGTQTHVLVWPGIAGSGRCRGQTLTEDPDVKFVTVKVCANHPPVYDWVPGLDSYLTACSIAAVKPEKTTGPVVYYIENNFELKGSSGKRATVTLAPGKYYVGNTLKFEHVDVEFAPGEYELYILNDLTIKNANWDFPEGTKATFFHETGKRTISASTLNNISFAGPVEGKITFTTNNRANNFSEFDPHWKKNVGCDNCQKDKKDACEFRKNENKSGGTSFEIFSKDLKIPDNSTKDYPTDLDTHDSLCVKESLKVQKQSTLNLNAIAVRVWNDFKTDGDQETINIAVPEGTRLESTGGKAYLMQ